MSPSFFIVGFQKCGTTTLYDAIMAHPDTMPGWRKENDLLAEGVDRLIDFKLCFPKKQKGKITGDASHLHTWMPYGLERIKAHFPVAKILVIMRNPVERAFSHFNMDQKIGYLPKSMTFEQLVEMEMSLRKNLSPEVTADEMYQQMRFYGNKYGWPLSRGMYYLYFEKLNALGLEYMPIFLEEMNQDFDGTLRAVHVYLGLKSHSIAQKLSNKGKYESGIPAAVEEQLEDFYRIPNQKLSALLNRSLPW